MTAKKELRKKMYSVLKNIPKEDIKAQSRIVTQKILNHPKFKSSHQISIYLSTDTEVDTIPLLNHIFEQSKQCFVPRFVPGSPMMQMVELESMKDYESLPCATWGIKQPSVEEHRKEVMDMQGLHLILTPGLAFTTQYHRLGHGRGYYDKFLTAHKLKFGNQAHIIGLALSQQIIDKVPLDDHDFILDEVIYAH